MSVEYIDHTADIALRADGATLEDAFCEAARGLFAVMVEIDAVGDRERLEVEAAADGLEGLLVEWLSRLLAEKDLSGLVFSRFAVAIANTGRGYELRGTGWGEPLDPVRHGAKIEVKGISYLGLAVRRRGGRWTIDCVFDV